jgi:hypothetical protein
VFTQFGYALARLVEWGEALLNPFFISKNNNLIIKGS